MSHPQDFDSLFQQARANCQQGRLAEGVALARRALAVDPRQAKAHVLLGMALLQLGDAQQALESFDAAIALQPDSADACGNRGDALVKLGRLPEAIASYRRALDLAPGSVENLCNLAATQLEQGLLDDALASYERLLALDPSFADAHFARAHVLSMLGRNQDAVAAYDAVLALSPVSVEALTGRANALTALDRPQDALASIDAAIAIGSANADVLSNRGYLLHRLHRYEDALASLDRAIAADPNHAEALGNRGVVLSDMGRHQDSLASFDRALTLSANAWAHCNRAKALVALNRNSEALASAEAATAIDPVHAEARYMRALLLTKLLRHGEAIADFERVLELKPQHPHALAQLTSCCLWTCDWERVASLAPRLKAAMAAGTAVVSPHVLLQLSCSPAEVLQGTRRYVESEIPPAVPLAPPQPRAAGERIRIAYLSGDFRVHPVGYLVAELFEQHDRTRFETVGISFGPDDRSDMRARLVRSFDRFHDVRTATDRDIAMLLRQLGVDIAVDLSGHTDNSRPGILQLRPAPVQVQYLGYAATMGVDHIDYIIADRIALPLEQQPNYAEQIVHLPDCFLVNDATRTISPNTPARRQMGLPERGFVFCCFNNSYKFSAAAFRVWMRLLLQVEGSVLWLSLPNPRAAENLRAAARAEGVDPARIVFAQRMPSMADHLARHRLADLFLDTPGYNAHSTAADALWAGLPLLTCAGEGFPSRVAASLLVGAGLPELVTDTIAGYEALALSLAREPATLDVLRQRLAQTRLSSPLFDTGRFRRHIEQAYVTMWQARQRGERPRSFAVAAIES